METKYLKPKEAAQRFQISERTLRDLVRLRQIPFIRIGSKVRFPAGALELWERAQMSGGSQA